MAAPHDEARASRCRDEGSFSRVTLGAGVIVGALATPGLPVPRQDLPHTLKLMTVWLLLGTVIFLGILAWQRHRVERRFHLDGQTVVLTRSEDGHFHWPGQVGDITVDFLVDTGATTTALPQALAERAGLKPLGVISTQTAGGAARGFAARADITLQGGMRAERLPVAVLPHLGAPLLGMDVLGRLHFSQKPGELRITPRPGDGG